MSDEVIKYLAAVAAVSSHGSALANLNAELHAWGSKKFTPEGFHLFATANEGDTFNVVLADAENNVSYQEESIPESEVVTVGKRLLMRHMMEWREGESDPDPGFPGFERVNGDMAVLGDLVIVQSVTRNRDGHEQVECLLRNGQFVRVVSRDRYYGVYTGRGRTGQTILPSNKLRVTVDGVTLPDIDHTMEELFAHRP